MKKMFFSAVLCIIVLCGNAFAADRVEVRVASEPIQYHSMCDKAGGFTLGFDAGTAITEGEKITIDLDFGVTLCRTIDLEISAGGSETAWTGANIPAGDGPVVAAAVTNPGESNDGVYFRLNGAAGSQRITLSVIGDGVVEYIPDDYLLVGADAGWDMLLLFFLDEQTNGDFAVDGIYSDPDHDGVYDSPAASGENTLMINVSQWDENTVNGNMDSKEDKYMFVPSNPQIAHLVQAVAGFSGSPTDILAGESVSFTDESTVGATAWLWEFGDGATSSEQNPTHCYYNPGVYTVSLTIVYSEGTSSVSRPDYIVVRDNNVPQMHVKEIIVIKGCWWNWSRAKAWIQIVDESGRGVPNAVVRGDWYGAANGAAEFTTNRWGWGNCISSWARGNGDFIFCVTDVLKAEWGYHRGANAETCDRNQ